MPEKKTEPSPWRLASVGLEMGLTLLAMVWLGHWADGKLHSDPWLMLLGLAMGLIAMTYKIWRLGRSFFPPPPP